MFIWRCHFLAILPLMVRSHRIIEKDVLRKPTFSPQSFPSSFSLLHNPSLRLLLIGSTHWSPTRICTLVVGANPLTDSLRYHGRAVRRGRFPKDNTETAATNEETPMYVQPRWNLVPPRLMKTRASSSLQIGMVSCITVEEARDVPGFGVRSWPVAGRDRRGSSKIDLAWKFWTDRSSCDVSE